MVRWVSVGKGTRVMNTVHGARRNLNFPDGGSLEFEEPGKTRQVGAGIVVGPEFPRQQGFVEIHSTRCRCGKQSRLPPARACSVSRIRPGND